MEFDFDLEDPAYENVEEKSFKHYSKNRNP